ncbi:MAG: methionine biosynthesis protein MetW [Elusimicrobia bacterium RIFOXYB2_FULL_48_7]|nr:MAG: methionine biosynthesis protein MetW [Elusimicrobia bacterium RIFOXYB2_FULL_48_7]
MPYDLLRIDHRIIGEIIHRGAKVIDLGCGGGELLYHLANVKNAAVQGIELNESAIYKCVEKGLSVMHGDLDNGLSGFPDKSFDYVILNQSLQQVRKVEYVIKETFRIGNKVIIGFPNFAHLKARAMLFFGGKAPVTGALPDKWHETPNLRFLSIKDFKEFCSIRGIKVEKAYYLGKYGTISLLPNLFTRNAVFVLSKETK